MPRQAAAWRQSKDRKLASSDSLHFQLSPSDEKTYLWKFIYNVKCYTVKSVIFVSIPIVNNWEILNREREREKSSTNIEVP